MSRFGSITPPEDSLTPQDIATGAVAAAPFVVVLFALYVFVPVTTEQVLQADPLVAAFDAWVGRPFIPAAAAAVVGWWGLKTRPFRAVLWESAEWAALGASAALLITLVIRLIAGEHLPAFIPPEESARPGLRQGLAAGVIEEALFRLIVLPTVYFGLRKRAGEAGAKLAAIVATGVLFALSHEVGPLAGELAPRLFATRVLFPGILMSAVFFLLSPAFIIAAHCAAHLLIPFLFV